MKKPTNASLLPCKLSNSLQSSSKKEGAALTRPCKQPVQQHEAYFALSLGSSASRLR